MEVLTVYRSHIKEEIKMINRRILGGIMSAVMLCSAVTVSAAGFSDVENVESVAWAEPYINEMAELGYIKGYEDGTFQPNKTISKTEALILLARMVGVDEESYADSVEYALAEYDSVVSEYSTSYPKEISFLLYTGVIKESELDSYISAANKNTALKRYEAAVLLTKLLGAEEEVLGNAFVSSSYADTVEIPDSARAYVEYVKESGIMQGMGDNEEGMPLFSPNTGVTRSQMAKMLCTLIDVLDISTQTGIIVSVDDFNDSFTATIGGVDLVNEVSAATKFKIGGKDVALEDLTRGMSVKITHLNQKVSLVENHVVLEDTVIKGLVSSTRESAGTRTVVIVDANDKTDVTTYTLADDAKIRVGGAIDTFSKVKANNYVALTISDGLVTELEVIDKSSSASGTLVSVGIKGDTTVLNIENSSGEIVSYEASNDGVQVSRNSLESNISALMEGDSVNLKMTYGKVTKILASSKSQMVSGKISFITFSVNGTKIGIDVSGEVNEYTVNKSVEVLIDSGEGTVYDLRPGSDIEVRLQSAEIVKIEAAGAVAKSQLTGVIKSSNATYGLIIIEEDGVEYNVFANGNTKIIDSKTGMNIALKSVEKGRIATVTGSNSSGVLEATVIVIQ